MKGTRAYYEGYTKITGVRYLQWTKRLSLCVAPLIKPCPWRTIASIPEGLVILAVKDKPEKNLRRASLFAGVSE